MRARYRFNNRERAIRRRAEATLRDPDASLWQISRAKTFLRETEESARARQENRQAAQPPIAEPMNPTPSEPDPKVLERKPDLKASAFLVPDPLSRGRGDIERRQMFLEALRTGRPWPTPEYLESLREEAEERNRRASQLKNSSLRTAPKRVTPEPSETPVEDTSICPTCCIERRYCSHTRQPGSPDALAFAIDRGEKLTQSRDGHAVLTFESRRFSGGIRWNSQLGAYQVNVMARDPQDEAVDAVDGLLEIDHLKIIRQLKGLDPSLRVSRVTPS